MPPLIYELVRRKVIEQWINGFPRDKIASDLQIGAGTVSNTMNILNMSFNTTLP